MGLILDKIRALATKWKQYDYMNGELDTKSFLEYMKVDMEARDEKIDAILERGSKYEIEPLQELAELIETLQKDAEVVKQILETVKKRQDEFGAKIEQLDESISRAKKGFWGRLIFGSD